MVWSFLRSCLCVLGSVVWQLELLLVCALLLYGDVVGFVRKFGLSCSIALTWKKIVMLGQHSWRCFRSMLEFSHRVWTEPADRPVLLGSIQNLSPLKVRTALAVSVWKRISSLHGFLSFFWAGAGKLNLSDLWRHLLCKSGCIKASPGVKVNSLLKTWIWSTKT